MIYIVDLDNTLVNTDILNNAAYNFALAEEGFVLKSIDGRLTRDRVFEEYEIVEPETKTRIIELKQSYFAKHLEESELNKSLMDFLLIDNKRFVIWTSADCQRAIRLIEFHGISNKSEGFYFLEKTNLSDAINKITMELNCAYKDICVIDDDFTVVKNLVKIGVNAVSISDFMDAIY